GDGLRAASRETTRRERRRPDNQDMLWEILFRLPQDLYSLPRASAVCKQWRGILIDPKFLCRFHAHHRKPPLLGLFHYSTTQIVFTPVLALPDRITPGRFSLGHCSSNILLDSRHGRVLVKDLVQKEIVVCDPITSKQHRMAIPPEFIDHYFSAAVLCAVSDQGHVHGGCHSCPFKVVLVSIYGEGQTVVCVYSSETATWGGLISTEAPHDGCLLDCPGTLVGSVLYWPLHIQGDNILEFDLDTQNLTVIKGPPDMQMYMTIF
uniref:F-box domain-containing protein n=1 Tax=Aegilops tauschii subsp. strangulata TaxID=200361 RepID=A0A453DPT2_AEGTS